MRATLLKPEASPSIPSIRLIALVIKATVNFVKEIQTKQKEYRIKKAG